MRLLLFSLLFLPLCLTAQPEPGHNLVFPEVPTHWDEALPMGNGLSGCLLWQKDGKLRLALDRADLWDLRPMNGLNRAEFSYNWVAEQVQKKDYGIVQEYFDAPYEQEPGPTKLPGGAMEFSLANLNSKGHTELDISTGLSTISWPNGQRFETFVHAGKQEGWFRCTGFPEPDQCFQLLVPNYGNNQEALAANSVQGSDLARLGYPKSAPMKRKGVWLFHQSAWGGFSYEIAVCFRQINQNTWEGVWCISSHFPQKPGGQRAEKLVRKAIKRGFDKSFSHSRKWWSAYWAKSALQIPDTLLERQYYRDLYKFGSCARENGPMISLQAVWTADNGRLPPWKGDLHHDLNTQMSYWPAYTANHLPEGMSYLKHLESNEAAHRAYTRRYFGTSGLNIPGVSTLLGAEMGGWIQYACSPTTAAWCAQHFYLHWRYSKDQKFLEQHAWPFLHSVAIHLEELSRPTKPGEIRRLPLSSSPEINNNDISAWFPNTWTNYDLALTRFVFEKTAELARELNLPSEIEKWEMTIRELPEFSLEPGGALMIGPTLPYRSSHRHFSHLMGIYPLGLLSFQDPAERNIIRESLHLLDTIGTRDWCGYSFAWLGNLRARALDGAGARDALRIFAEAFVSPNSFHLNGDQSGKGYSSFTYRPFTLEGNFAFAAGIQEMLLQSDQTGIKVFPAIPDDWSDCSFEQLRADGAFLVSAKMVHHQVQSIEILSEQGGILCLQLPKGNWINHGNGLKINGEGARGIRCYLTQPGQRLVFHHEEN